MTRGVFSIRVSNLRGACAAPARAMVVLGALAAWLGQAWPAETPSAGANTAVVARP